MILINIISISFGYGHGNLYVIQFSKKKQLMKVVYQGSNQIYSVKCELKEVLLMTDLCRPNTKSREVSYAARKQQTFEGIY